MATADPFQARGLKRSTVNVANAVKPTAKTNLSVIDGGRGTRKSKKRRIEMNGSCSLHRKFSSYAPFVDLCFFLYPFPS